MAPVSRPSPAPLSAKQTEILAFIVQVHELLPSKCRVSLIAEKFKINRTTTRVHLEALRRKGWLRSVASPVVPSLAARNFLRNREN